MARPGPRAGLAVSGQRRVVALYDARKPPNARRGLAMRRAVRYEGNRDRADIGPAKDNLPAEVTRFIGRRRELPAIGDAIERHRLVTLRGAGGVGKTRLALRVAADLRMSFADGCWLVQLSPLQAPELLARTVSEALGLPDEAAGDAPQVLAQNLAERELLLLLDTCEHLTGPARSSPRCCWPPRPGCASWRRAAPPLALPDEHSLLITPLELPAADDATAAHADAVTLFVDRATGGGARLRAHPGEHPRRRRAVPAARRDSARP